MIALLAVALITLLASIVPGPDFAMVTRNSYLHGRRAGLLAALGIALGVQVHVFYTMFGVGLIIASAPALFTVIKTVGAVYLIVIGWKTWSNRAGLVIDLHGGDVIAASDGIGRGSTFTVRLAIADTVTGAVDATDALRLQQR